MASRIANKENISLMGNRTMELSLHNASTSYRRRSRKTHFTLLGQQDMTAGYLAPAKTQFLVAPSQADIPVKPLNSTSRFEVSRSRQSTRTQTSVLSDRSQLSFANQSFNRTGPIKTNFSIIDVKQSQTSTDTWPITPAHALKAYPNLLTEYEKAEILSYKAVYYLSACPTKIQTGHFDDAQGDYKINIGDQILYQYEVLEVLGSGTFGKVLKCFDHKYKTQIALKVIKNKSNFRQQAAVEVKVLRKLLEADPQDRFNIVRIQHYFVFRGHMCITFELLSINLYDVLKRKAYTGLGLDVVKRFAHQMLQCLRLMRVNGVIHCDLKPENILLKSLRLSDIKVIDFGSACLTGQKVYSYIQSRYYRAPEILLGLSYGPEIDMWSFGCIIAELATGRPIFPGENEKDQLQCIMQALGPPPTEMSMSTASTRKRQFFDAQGMPVLTANSRGQFRLPGSTPLTQTLASQIGDTAFIELVGKCLAWRPNDRPTPDQAIRDVWFSHVRA